MIPQISYSGPCWFALYTAPATELRLEQELSGLDYRAFLPKLRRWVSHARVKRAVEKPLLSRYLFVEVDYPRQSFADVLGCRGAERLIGCNGTPIPIPRRFVENLLKRQLQGEFDEAAKGKAPVGARVRVVEGQFEDMLATVTGGKGNKLTIKLFESRVETSVSVFAIRAA